MIEIKPIPYSHFSFPYYHKHNISLEDVIFYGMHILGKCYCLSSQRRFYHTFPIGHSLWFPIAFSEDGKESSYSGEAALWLAQPLIQNFTENRQITAPIQKIVHRKESKAILLNCLDNCYGHSLVKLMNAHHHLTLHQDFGLILLIPKNLLWMVPKGVAEVWYVDAPLSNLQQRITHLDTFVKAELQRFEQFYLSFAFMHLDYSQIDLSLFTRTVPFDLTQFHKAIPQITFVCREDRFWLTHRSDLLFYLAVVKLNWLKIFRFYFIYKQNRLINRTAQSIRKKFKGLNLMVVGLGKSMKFDSIITDRRVKKQDISEEVEREWCEIYKTSHIVIGVHGSHMLIPTALAAGFINMLPPYKIPHLSEDTQMKSINQREPFLERYLPLFVRPNVVATHVISMIKDFFYHFHKERLSATYNVDEIIEKYHSFHKRG